MVNLVKWNEVRKIKQLNEAGVQMLAQRAADLESCAARTRQVLIEVLSICICCATLD